MWRVVSQLGSTRPTLDMTTESASEAVKTAKKERDFYRRVSKEMGGGLAVTGNITKDKEYIVWDVTKRGIKVRITVIRLEKVEATNG